MYNEARQYLEEEDEVIICSVWVACLTLDDDSNYRDWFTQLKQGYGRYVPSHIYVLDDMS